MSTEQMRSVHADIISLTITDSTHSCARGTTLDRGGIGEMEYVVTAVLLIITSLLFLLWTKSRRDKRWPPGPPTVPFIGNLNLDMTDKLATFRKLRQQYGDIYSLILGSQTVVVVNGLDTLKELFVKHGDVVSSRPDDFVMREICHFKGIAGTSGSLWKEHRTFALSKLREFGFGKRSMEGRILEEVEVFLNCVKDTKGDPFNINDLIHTSVSNVICSIALGNRYEHNDKHFQGLTQAVSENLGNPQISGLLTFLPFLKYVPGDPAGYDEVIGNVAGIIGYLKTLIDDHKKNDDDDDDDIPTNYIDAYIHHQKETRGMETTFSDEQLLRTIADLFAAGTETTSTAVKWFILFMLHKPDIQKRMREEINDIVGDSRFPSLADRDKLSFSDAVLHETLRFGNIAPFSLPHGMTQDLEFKGHIIPKHAMLIPCLDSVLNDPEIFKNPLEFNPSRFLTENGSLTGTEKVYTFGIGRRVCLGEALARMELFLFCTSLIQRFQLVTPEGVTLPSISEGHLGTSRSPLPYSFQAVELA